MSDELKPCPSCKSKDIRTLELGRLFNNLHGWIAECLQCHFYVQSDYFEKDVIAAWNRRADNRKESKDD